MTELYDALTPDEIRNIETHWGTTLPELKRLAIEHDERVRLDAIAPENKRTPQQGKMLDKMSFENIIGMTNVKNRRKPIEYQDEDPFALKQEDLVKIVPKDR